MLANLFSILFSLRLYSKLPMFVGALINQYSFKWSLVPNSEVIHIRQMGKFVIFIVFTECLL